MDELLTVLMPSLALATIWTSVWIRRLQRGLLDEAESGWQARAMILLILSVPVGALVLVVVTLVK